MSSANYKIVQDSLNYGGSVSSSTNYSLNDTAGDVAPGSISSTNYTIGGGYLPMNETTLSISLLSPTSLSSLQDQTSGSSTDTSPVTVTTDDPAGYALTVSAATSPLLEKGSDSIADYAETASGTPEFWSVATGDAAFGFSVSGSNVPGLFKDNGSACGSGSANGLCFMGFKGTNPITIGSMSTRTSTSGDTTTLHYQMETKGATISPGTYGGTLTLTATAN